MYRNVFDQIANYSSDPDLALHVPFVPTDDDVVEAMLNLADVGPDDVLYDLGSGDGRILVTAARDRNTRGVGIDLDPERIVEAVEFAEASCVEHLVDFIEDDIFTVDFSEATVVTMYLLQSVNVQLRPLLLSQLRPGTRIVSHAFDMGDWKPDEWVRLSGGHIFKWIVPAQISGVWEWPSPCGRLFRFDLQQQFQKISGNAWLGDKKIHWEDAELRGDCLQIMLRTDARAPVEEFTLQFDQLSLSEV